MGVLASESAAYCPVRTLVVVPGAGAPADVMSEVGANATGPAALDCAAAEATKPKSIQATELILAIALQSQR